MDLFKETDECLSKNGLLPGKGLIPVPDGLPQGDTLVPVPGGPP